jgi:hypothetical protein
MSSASNSIAPPWLPNMLLLAVFAMPAAAADWTATKDKTEPPKVLAGSVRETLEHSAIDVKNGSESVLRIWLRSDVPSGADAEKIRAGLSVKDLPETLLIAAIEFNQPLTDYRKQSIAAGVYTLRVAIQPDTGDHKDTAPHREFAMLAPAASDRDPDTLDLKDLLKLSRAATAADHPGVMLLFPVKQAAADPKIVDKGKGVKALECRLTAVGQKGSSGTMALSIVVEGTSTAR